MSVFSVGTALLRAGGTSALPGRSFSGARPAAAGLNREQSRQAMNLNPVEAFSDYIAKQGLKNTPQRRLIVDVFFTSGKHLSTEELYDRVRAVDDGVGQATVYRTLKLLCEADLAREMHFGDGTARYEPITDDSHHDHLICTVCGRNQEFVNEDIERLQEELAARYGFVLTSHRMYLYGVCDKCRKEKSGGGRRR